LPEGDSKRREVDPGRGEKRRGEGRRENRKSERKKERKMHNQQQEQEEGKPLKVGKKRKK
jgi:hypothetical protein